MITRTRVRFIMVLAPAAWWFMYNIRIAGSSAGKGPYLEKYQEVGENPMQLRDQPVRTSVMFVSSPKRVHPWFTGCKPRLGGVFVLKQSRSEV